MSIFEQYIKSTKENFPLLELECVRPIKEEGVYESDIWYEGVIVNQKFPDDGYRVCLLRPYIWTDGKSTLFGWLSENPNVYYDNLECPIHNNDMVVVGFKPTDKSIFDQEMEMLSVEIRKNWEEE